MLCPKDKKEANMAHATPNGERSGMRLERKARNSQAMASFCSIIWSQQELWSYNRADVI